MYLTLVMAVVSGRGEPRIEIYIWSFYCNLCSKHLKETILSDELDCQEWRTVT